MSDVTVALSICFVNYWPVGSVETYTCECKNEAMQDLQIDTIVVSTKNLERVTISVTLTSRSEVKFSENQGHVGF